MRLRDRFGHEVLRQIQVRNKKHVQIPASEQPLSLEILVKDAGTGTPPTTTSSGEIPASEPPLSSRRRGGGQKRKWGSLSGGISSSPPNAPTKRQAREKPAAVPFPPIHNGPLTRARLQPSSSASFVAAASQSEAKIEESDVTRKDVGGIEKVKGEQELSEPLKVNSEDSEANIDAKIEAIRSRDANAHVVPNHAGWFSWTAVHPLEEKSLSSFFNGILENRTPEIYMEIRNWIMEKFHANPNVPIELNNLTEISVGDQESRLEVMEFLDYWGLINYHPFQKTDPTVTDVVYDAVKAENTDSLLKSLFCFETEHSSMSVITRNSVATPAAPSGLVPESVILTEDLDKSEGPSVEYHCNSCSADCSRKRFHCQKQADFDLCPECFNKRTFGSDIAPSDFILMEPAESGGASSEKWTDQETLLLLEALELFKENWNEIADHVATKTKAQCILHFVQMPIEDVFFDIGDDIESTSKEYTNTILITNDTIAPETATKVTEKTNNVDDNQPSSMEKSKPEDVSDSHVSNMGKNLVMKALSVAFEDVGLFSSSSGHISFAEAGNPVMTLAAFLVNLVEPNIASVSARNSLKFISGKGDQLALRNCFFLEDPPDNKNSAHSGRIDTEMDGSESEKEEVGNVEKQKSDMDVDGCNTSNEKNNNSSFDLARKEDKASTTSSLAKVEVVHPTSDSSDISAHKLLEPAKCKESNNACIPNELELGSAEASGKLPMDVEVPPCFEMEQGDAAIQEKPSESMKVPNVSSENKDPAPVASSSLTDENGANKESGDLKTKNDDDPGINRISSAAVTTISALSVKAKLLANQEEEQIHQLASLLIDKQLYKLEISLSFLNEMENLVMRFREQLERSRMRLFHERAQIIAAQLGISSSRPMQQPLPANANSAPRPPFIGMSGQRLPVSQLNMMSDLSHQDHVSSVTSK